MGLTKGRPYLWVLISIVLSQATRVQADCPPPQPAEELMNQVQGAADAVINPIDSQLTAANEVISASQAYYSLLTGPPKTNDVCANAGGSSTPHFDTKAAIKRVSQLQEIGNNEKLTPQVRSYAFVLIGGLMNLVAQQDRSGSEGKAALNAIKSAITADPTNSDAVVNYAQSIIAIKNLSWPTRPFVVGAIGIKLEDEINRAKEELKRVNGPDCLTQALNK